MLSTPAFSMPTAFQRHRIQLCILRAVHCKAPACGTSQCWKAREGLQLALKILKCLGVWIIFGFSKKVSWTIFSDPRQGRMLRSQGWVPSTQPCNCCWGRSWDEVWLSPEPIRNPRFLPWQAAPPADIQGSPPLASQAYLFERMAPSRWCRSLIVAEARPFYV